MDREHPRAAPVSRTRPHGYARYSLDGCRCYVCGLAASEYNARRARMIAYGTWEPFVPAQPVREHIEALRACGMGLRTIAAAADVSRQRLHSIASGRSERGTGPQEKVRPTIAAAIIAVEPTLENLAPHAPIASTGTHRRLHALVAGGWPQAQLAHRIGWTEGNFSTLLTSRRVLVRTALLVRSLYDLLWAQDPLEHGVLLHDVNRARNHAASRNWAPVGAWDDDTIDDPDAFPDWTGNCGTPKGFWAHYRLRIRPVCAPCRAARAAAEEQEDRSA